MDIARGEVIEAELGHGPVYLWTLPMFHANGWTFVWTITAVVLTAAVVAGNAALSDVSYEPLSILLAFAGGAVLASLAGTLMPDAYREGGKLVAFATAAGFLLSFLVSQ